MSMSSHKGSLDYVHHVLGSLYYGAGLLGIAAVGLRVFGKSGWWVAAALATVALSLVAYLIRRRRVSLCPGFVNPSLKVSRYVARYVVAGENRYRLEQDIEVEALAHGVDAFRSKQKWSGEGEAAYQLVPSSLGRVAAHKTDDMYDCMMVSFGTPLGKGNVAEFNVVTEMIDHDNKARPFLGKIIDDWYPRSFTLCVKWDQNAPEFAERQTFSSARASTPIKRRRVKIKDGQHAWRPMFTQFHYKYQIAWEDRPRNKQ